MLNWTNAPGMIPLTAYSVPGCASQAKRKGDQNRTCLRSRCLQPKGSTVMQGSIGPDQSAKPVVGFDTAGAPLREDGGPIMAEAMWDNAGQCGDNVPPRLFLPKSPSPCCCCHLWPKGCSQPLSGLPSYPSRSRLPLPLLHHLPHTQSHRRKRDTISTIPPKASAMTDMEMHALVCEDLTNATVNDLSWEGVTVSVKQRKSTEPKLILSNINGTIRAGNANHEICGWKSCGELTQSPS